MNPRLTTKALGWVLALLIAPALPSFAQGTPPPVQVTLNADNPRLKVGESTTLHVLAQVAPDQSAGADQIFSWYVDLLNSNGGALQLDPGGIQVPASDRDPSTSSLGVMDGANLRGVHDTLLGLPGAGRDAPVELFSIAVHAVGTGQSTFRVAAGTGVIGLAADFLVAPAGLGDPLLGGDYSAASVQLTCFLNTPPTLDAIPDAAVDEGRLFTMQAQASDPDSGQTLAFSLVGDVPAGAVINPASGVLTWTPSEAQGPRAYRLSVRVADSASPPLSVTNTFTLTVNEVNTPPRVTTPSARTVQELATITATCTGADSDILPDRSPSTNRITFSLASPPGGASIDPVTGVFSWTPTEAQGPAAYAIAVVVSDDAQPPLRATNTFNVTVTEVNRAPSLVAPPAQSIGELSTLSVAFSASDPDLPANQISFVLVSGPPGVVLDSGTGVVTWTPTESQGPGSYPISVSTIDNGTPPLAVTNSFLVTVTELNSSPVLAVIPDQAASELTQLTVATSATDADLPAQRLTYALVGAPPGATINASSGVITWTPSEAQGGATITVVVRVTDDGTPPASDTKSFDVRVAEVNRAPTLTAPADRSIAELSALSVSFSAADPDSPPNLISYSLLNAPAGVTLDAGTGAVTWTPSEAQGPGVYTIVVVATDNGSPALSATNQCLVTVAEANTAPTLSPIADRSVRALSALSLTNVASDGDMPAQTITFSLVNPPQGVSIAPGTGVLTWTPGTAQAPGNYTITVVATDSGSPPLSATNSFLVSVTRDNSAPVFVPVGDRTAPELSLLTVTNVATDADAPGQSLSFSLLSPPAGATINATNGVFAWTPSEAQGPGVFTIAVVATDSGTPALSATNLFQVTVTEVNSAPTLSPGGNRSVRVLSTLTVTNVATDGDLPAQTIAFSLVNPPQGVSITPVSGVLTWTPSEAQGPGNYTITVVATDSGSPPLSATNSFLVNVTRDNSAPVFVPVGDRTAPELSLLTVTNVATDADAPGQSLTFSLISPPSGATVNATNGVFTWTPSEVQGPGVFTIAVVATDNGTPALSATNRFQVTVSEVNAAPTLSPVADRSVRILTTLTVTNVATDVDVPAQTITFSLLNPPQGASIAPGTGVLTWTPGDAQGPGNYTLTVVATDSGSPPLSATNSFQVSVSRDNSAPVFLPVADRTAPELSVLSVTNVATDADAPTQTLTFSLLSPPSGATINATNGVFTWTPSEAQGPGVFAIVVVATDNGTPALSATNRFQVTVQEVNTAPGLASVADRNVREQTTLVVTNVATDGDLPAQGITFSLLNPPQGAFIAPDTGVLTWTPSEAQGPGIYTITVVARDQGSLPLAATNSFQVNVTEENTAPALAPLADRVVNELSLLTVTNIVTDVDVPSQGATFSLLNPPAGATINATNGVLTWTPSEAQGPGVFTIAVVATDNGTPALSATNRFQVTVLEVNSAPGLAPVADRSVRELTTLVVTNVAVDGDLPAQGITFSLLNPPQGAFVAPDTGVLTWTPSEAQGPGSYTITVVARDQGSLPLAATNTFQVNVTEENAAPVLAPLADRVMPELASLAVSNVVTDADVPAQAVTFTLLSPPAGASINATNGVFTWTPSELQGPGVFTIAVVATDNGTPSLSATNRFQVTVQEVNTAPALAPVGDRAIRALRTLSVTNVAADSDLPAQGITFSLVDPPQGAFIAPGTGVFTWTPSEAQVAANHTITVVATDNGSPQLSATNSFRVSVTRDNSAPVFLPTADRTVPELSLVTVTNVATDAESPEQTVTFSLFDAPAGATVNATNGVFTWTPSEAQGPGVFTIAVVATDSGTPALSATNRFQVTVTEVNLAPVLAAVADQSVSPLSTLVVTNAASDADLPANALTFSLVDPPAGAAIDAVTGVFTWTPTSGQGSSNYVVQVRVADSGVPSLSATRTFQVSVGGGGGGTTQPAFLTALSHDAAGFRMQITGQPHGRYTIEASTDLAHWTAIGTVTLGDGPTTTYVDARPNAGTFHFYRAVAAGGGGSAPPATITSVALEPGGFRLNISGQPRARYIIEFTTDIPNWAPLETITFGDGATFSYLDRLATTRPFGFYRIRSP